MIRVLITDDHPIVRQGLRELLEDDKDKRFGFIEEAGNGKEMFEKLNSFDFDVILLDISLPGRGGLELLEDIRRLKPELPVLVISTYPEEQYALSAMKFGASGYIQKTGSPMEILNAVFRVSQGLGYITQSLSDKMAENNRSDKYNSYTELLSPREIEVISLLGSGKTLAGIAKELCLSPKTISSYRARILLKLGLKTTADIIKFAISQDFV
jgi:two-component system invasion response regulator UvrY